jgi:hypothetical protein
MSIHLEPGDVFCSSHDKQVYIYQCLLSTQIKEDPKEIPAATGYAEQVAS